MTFYRVRIHDGLGNAERRHLGHEGPEGLMEGRPQVVAHADAARYDELYGRSSRESGRDTGSSAEGEPWPDSMNPLSD